MGWGMKARQRQGTSRLQRRYAIKLLCVRQMPHRDMLEN